MIKTIFSVASGVVLGGIVLSWLSAKGQSRINKFRQYWETNYSTPLHMAIFISAKDSLLDDYSEDYVDKVVEWADKQKLMGSPEKRLAKLDLLSEGDILKDPEIRRYCECLRHWAVRQWATSCGLNDAFEQWERECIVKLNEVNRQMEE